MTFDCFLFFNELDLLELRLKTLSHVVDRFVLIEGEETFSGRPKPLYYQENRDRFSEWADRITVVTVPRHDTASAWEREHIARDGVAEGTLDADADDWLFCSDVDEIWRPELRDAEPEAERAAYQMYHSYYFLNTPRLPLYKWRGTRRVRKKDWIGGQALRGSHGTTIPNGGWHFSFLGDADAASEKLRAYSHTEYSEGLWANKWRIASCIKSGTDLIDPNVKYLPVPISESFPRPILEEPERWARFIRPVPAP